MSTGIEFDRQNLQNIIFSIWCWFEGLCWVMQANLLGDAAEFEDSEQRHFS